MFAGMAAAGVGAAAGLLGMGIQAAARRKTWKREDTAVQRRVADLKAAGLSPTLAAGSAAQTMQPVGIDPGQVVDKAQIAMTMMRQKADISLTNQQAELIKLKKAEQMSMNRVATGTEIARIAGAYNAPILQAASIAEIGGKVNKLVYDLKYAKDHGWPTTGMDFRTRLGTYAIDRIKKGGLSDIFKRKNIPNLPGPPKRE